MPTHLLEKPVRFMVYAALHLSIVALTDQNAQAYQHDFRLINKTSYDIVHTNFPRSISVLTAQNLQGDRRDFTLINKTSYDIVSVFISPVYKDDWEEDVLGRSVLYKGQYTTIRFSGYPNNVCYFDVKVKFDDDTSLTRSKINLCKTSSYTIRD